jgi:hypothetical protein
MWSPLLGEPRIVVPGNVRRVEFFRQRVNRPHGHALVAENDHTELIDRGLLQLSHARIDDSRAFHSVALQACA